MSTWNPSDKHFSVTLSGGNLTATIVSPSNSGGVRSTDSHSTGKWYFEAVITSAVANTQGPVIGVQDSFAPLFDYAGQDFGEGWGFMLSTSANKISRWAGGIRTILDSTNTATDGDIAMLALDLTSGKLWFGRNGTWYGATDGGAAGDPAAGTNPAFTSVSGTLFAECAGSAGANSVITGRFSVGAFSYTPPSGFTAWDGSTITYVTADGTSTGTSTAVAYSPFADGVAVGTSTVQAYTGSSSGIADGTSTASAVGQTIREGVGTATGISAVFGSDKLTISKNWLYGPYADPDAAIRVGTYETLGTATPQLHDGNKTGTSYTVAATALQVISIDLGDFHLVDKIVIWSSTVEDASDQLAFPTFTLAQNGMVGNVDEELIVYDAFSGLDQLALVTGNRATRFEINVPQTDTDKLLIMGHSPIGLKPGTVLLEIEVSQTYTLYEAECQSTANVVSNTQLGRTITLVSTANATSTISDFETQTEISRANVTSNVSTQADVDLTFVSTADATSSASGDISFTLVSTANVTSVVPDTPLIATYASTANATSSILSTTTRTNISASTANATSSVEATRFVQLVSTANITSSLAETSVTPGALVSTANATSNVADSYSLVVWGGYAESISHANITSAIVGNVYAHSTYVSTADIRAYIILPGLPEGLSSLWCNPITHAAASWSGLPFESAVEVDGVVYAAGEEGIYVMEDELEEGTEVSAYVTWDLLDFGDPRKHRPGDFMIDGTAGAPLKVTVANEQGRYSYLTHLPENTKTTNFRARLGKGLHSRHLRFTVENTKSKEFWFDAAEIEVIQLSRHIGGRHA